MHRPAPVGSALPGAIGLAVLAFNVVSGMALTTVLDGQRRREHRTFPEYAYSYLLRIDT